MRAARVHAFGGPSVITIEEIDRPTPGEGEVLVRVRAAGVGPWDSWVRAGKSVLPQPLPLTLGADLSGTVEAVGLGVSTFAPGDAVYGVTNPRFVGATAEFAIASATMIAQKPERVDFGSAAGVPVVAVTAKQMLFEHGGLRHGQTVLVQGAAGNVGSYAVQLARLQGAHVVASDHTRRDVDLVIDTIGPAVHPASFAVLRPGGRLISAVAAPDAEAATRAEVSARFILVDVNTTDLDRIRTLLDEGSLHPRVSEVLPLERVVEAHEMLDGIRPRPTGKIVLRVSDS